MYLISVYAGGAYAEIMYGTTDPSEASVSLQEASDVLSALLRPFASTTVEIQESADSISSVVGALATTLAENAEKPDTMSATLKALATVQATLTEKADVSTASGFSVNILLFSDPLNRQFGLFIIN